MYHCLGGAKRYARSRGDGAWGGLLRKPVFLQPLDRRYHLVPTTSASMLTSFALIQVICCYFANGILTPESIPLPFFSRRTSNIKQNNWNLLLKSATFRTLSKFTDFSPSLDMKMEADTLLWEKLEGAKYIRKGQKRQEEPDNIKTGLLVDMTRDAGYLEFRQIDNSRYNFEPKDNRILALWKVQKLNKNHYLIQIKIPLEPPIEDTYEYTAEKGLQEIKIKDKEYNKTKHYKSFSRKSNDNKSARSIEPIDKIQSIKRQDVVRTQPSNINTYKISDNYKAKATPQAYVYKPAQYYTIVGFQTPSPIPKYQTWSQPNDYYSINSYKLFPEFKQNSEYNGFIPSVGPTGNPPLYQSNPLEPITYKQFESYYPTYPSSQLITTQKPIPLTYFKPSAEFIQYSEVDPFYTTEVNPVVTAEISTVDPKQASVGEYQQIIYKSPIPAISIDIPPLKPGESLYDSVINTINNETLIKENAAEPTSTTLVINYPQKSNNFNEKQTISTTEPPVTTTTPEVVNLTTEKLTKIRAKNIPKSPHISSLMKTDNYDYAPLYIRWGEKIRPQENKSKTTTQKTVTDTDKNVYLNKYEEVIPDEINDYVYENDPTSNETTEKHETTTVENEIKETSKPDYTTTTEPLEINTTNYVIKNITMKSPEEIVSDLTTMGLINSTMILADKRNEQVKLDKSEKEVQEKKEPKKYEDNQEEGSEPISVVVNRISQSYSYKTSVGHIGNLKQLRELT